MAYADSDGCSIYYDVDTADPEAETVVFLGDLGFGAWQWGWQYNALGGLFETIVYDHRGCGRSDSPSGPYAMADLVDDLEAVLVDANVRRAHLVGCGLGGCVALAAARHTSRAESLTLIGTPASGEAFDPSDIRADPADTNGLRASTTALLSTEFCEAHPEVVDRIVDWRADEDAPPAVQQAQLAAIEGFDAEPLYEITRPALVVAGGDDRVVDREASQRLAEDLPKGKFIQYPEAGHLLTVERSAALNDELVGFLESSGERSK
jgi:pimeloyl-ACP methyl ester carboxylesterase